MLPCLGNVSFTGRYQRVLAQNLVVLAFQKKGFIPASSVTLDGSKFSVPSGEKAMMWNPPVKGVLCLTFESMRMPPKLDACFPAAEIQFTLVALSKSVMASQRRAIIELITSSDMYATPYAAPCPFVLVARDCLCMFFRPNQAREIFFALRDNDERLLFVSKVIHHMA
jgi:hypothetical protein